MLGSALQIARQANGELGLTPPLELVASAEQTSIQLLALLNAAGNELVSYYDWEFLLKKHVITTEAGKSAYPRPSDYARQINQTAWDKTSRRPASGPISPQNWQTLTNATTLAGPFVRYRAAGRNTEFLPTPAKDGMEYNYQYVSNGWVQSYTDPEKFGPLVVADQDVIQFDFWLMVKFLKLKLWQAKGMDTTALMADFSRAFDAATGQDHGAPVLNMSGDRNASLIGAFNLPDGNWNQGT